MTEHDSLAERFEGQRPRLRAIAHRILGSAAEGDDAVQEAWLRLARVDHDSIDNLPGWLTTVVARVCLDMLRARKARREDSADVLLPDPVVTDDWTGDPEQAAVVADSVGLALLVVLETLSPAERLAFVLHDTFGLPFEEIAPVVGRSPTAARQLASRARRRVRGGTTDVAVDLERQRALIDAFVTAARGGDFRALIAILDPDVVVRADSGPFARGAMASREIRGASEVAATALGFRRFAGGARRVLVDGRPGLVVFSGDRPFAVLAFRTGADRITSIEILSDVERLGRLELDPAIGTAVS
jgi:RNA polymerase sigma factor (sigma-70 family)